MGLSDPYLVQALYDHQRSQAASGVPSLLDGSAGSMGDAEPARSAQEGVPRLALATRPTVAGARHEPCRHHTATFRSASVDVGRSDAADGGTRPRNAPRTRHWR